MSSLSAVCSHLWGCESRSRILPAPASRSPIQSRGSSGLCAPPDSCSSCQTAPQSPRWIIGRRRPSQLLPASNCLSPSRNHSAGPGLPYILMKAPDFMSTATTTGPQTSPHNASRSATSFTNTPTTQFERSAAQRRRSAMAAAWSYPWLSLRATRSKGYVSGPPVGACRLIGRACIRGRKLVEGESGGARGSRGLVR
jgi:hypothetical protein